MIVRRSNESLLSLLKSNRVKGTLLVAAEGINGTVAGTSAGIKSLQTSLASDGRFDGIACKFSTAEEMPFPRTRVKLKKEIVTMGVTDIDPRQIVGTYVKAKEWNELISDPDVTVIDTRNEYEVLIGTFENAINPHTESFREFPEICGIRTESRRSIRRSPCFAPAGSGAKNQRLF